MQLANPENFKQFVQNKGYKTITTSETVAKFWQVSLPCYT